MEEKDEYDADAPTMFGGYPITGDYTLLDYTEEQQHGFKQHGFKHAALMTASAALAVALGAVAAVLLLFRNTPTVVAAQPSTVTVEAPAPILVTVTSTAAPLLAVTVTSTAPPEPQITHSRSLRNTDSENVDQRFLKRFSELTTLVVDDPQTVIWFAHEQCRYLAQPGATVNQDVDLITKKYTVMTRAMSYGVVESAVEAYCPQYSNEL